jgi:hypothetical protein
MQRRNGLTKQCTGRLHFLQTYTTAKVITANLLIFFLKKLTNADKISIDLSDERTPSIPLKVKLLLISSGSLQLSDGHNNG